MSKSTDRKNQILDAALRLSEKVGYHSVRRETVAEAAGCSTGLINRYFSTMPQLKRALLRYAVMSENLTVIAQAAVMKEPIVRKRASEDLITRALESIR